MTMRERVADEIRMYLIGDEVTALLVADAAIAAYEAIRPPVATDEELLMVYSEAVRANDDPRDDITVSMIAGIRAVRERLELPEVRMPEWVDNVSFYRHRWSDNQWSWTLEPDVMQRVEGAYREGSAPTFAEALADMLADVVADTQEES